MPVTTYGDISPRTAAKASKQLLKRGDELMVLERYGQSKPLGAHETKSISFRLYDALSNLPKVLTEGVTPASSPLTKQDIVVTLVQYGDYIELTDIVLDTHEDPVLQESIDICGQQAAEMLEIVRFGAIIGGTNVFYAGGVAARANVIGTMTKGLQRKVTTALRKQRAKPVTRIVKSTPSWGTQAIQPAYIAIIPVELGSVIRDMPGFSPAETYGTATPMPGEIGKVEAVRYVESNLIPTYPDSGATVGSSGMQSTTGTRVDVFPILIFGQDSFGTVPFKGKNGVTVMVRNPKPDSADPLAQRGSVGWKALHAALILNEAWIARVEVAVPVQQG
ncbi:MAG: N4-gp56 family major capsid protein [Desulfovibrio sp.]|jgi:N4-gp56 family major capsid protein|nr:N4-gp56 family major capsid protein [Desulfovibrio sp.]